MGKIVIAVECQAAGSARCFARELIGVAEELVVPLTWLITVSSRDPMGNVSLYHQEYQHRIPAWHEIGVRLDMRNGGDITSARYRADVVRLGKEMLKQSHIKPACCKVDGTCILASDIRNLEEMGLVVAVGTVTESNSVSPVPYHPAYDDPRRPGDARLLLLPESGLRLADDPANVIARIGEPRDPSAVFVITTQDDRDDTQALRVTVEAARRGGYAVQTLTSAATG